MTGTSRSARTTAKPIKWVKLTFPPRRRARWLLRMVRLISSSLAGTRRTDVAVGTAKLASMLATMRAAAPLSGCGRSPSVPGTVAAGGAGTTAGEEGAGEGATAAGEEGEGEDGAGEEAAGEEAAGEEAAGEEGATAGEEGAASAASASAASAASASARTACASAAWASAMAACAAAERGGADA